LSKSLFALGAVWLLLLALFPAQSYGYSFLTHQTIVDMAWEPAIKPVLLARYPHTTAAELRIAHAYAYGGASIQDSGYYPFGKEIFSDLTHYVRTGAFVSLCGGYSGASGRDEPFYCH
jgi:hypothetical protein